MWMLLFGQCLNLADSCCKILPPQSYIKTGRETLFYHISISGEIVLLTVVTVSAFLTALGSLCKGDFLWSVPLTMSLTLCIHSFTVLPSQSGQGSVSNSHLQHCSWCCSLLLLPMILFITLELPALPWALLKPLKVQLLDAERWILEVFLPSAGALSIQTLLPASFPLIKCSCGIWQRVGRQCSPLCWGYGPCLFHSSL